MGSDWTIESELLRLAHEPDLSSAIRSLDLRMPSGAHTENCHIVEVTGWQPGGAETYILHFGISHNEMNAGTVRYVLKACVASIAQGSIASTFDTWLTRRRDLADRGIQVPRLYAAHHATVLEEYIQYSLFDAIKSASNETLKLLHRSIVGTVRALGDGGYRPTSVHDWRSRGDDVVLVDFGEDLGSSSGRPSSAEDIGRLFEKALKSNDIAPATVGVLNTLDDSELPKRTS